MACRPARSAWCAQFAGLARSLTPPQVSRCIAFGRPVLRPRWPHRQLTHALQPGHRSRLRTLAAPTSAQQVMAPPNPQQAPASQQPASLLPVQLQGDALSVQQLPVLSAISPAVFASPCVTAAAQQGIVLGVQARSPTACEDVGLAEVARARFLSASRIKIWWQTPEWGARARDIQPETQFMLLELAAGGPYVVMLPLIDSNTFRATLRPPKRGSGADRLCLRIESGAEHVKGQRWDNALYIAAGSNPYELVDAAVVTAAALSGTSRPRAAKRQPATLDLFGWCTWDAFYFAVSAQGIQQGLQGLADAGVPPRYLIIDDGWQLTEVDEPYRQQDDQAHRVRPSPAQLAAAERSVSHGAAPGGDVNAFAHPETATEVRRRSNTSAGPSAAGLPHLESSAASTSSSSVDSSVAVTAGAGKQPPAQHRRQNPLAHVLLAVLAIFRAVWGFVEARVLHAINGIVQDINPPQWSLRLLSLLAQGALRDPILRLYAGSGDHSRRLSSVRANAKFASPQSGPQEPWEVGREDLKGVVTDLKQRFGLDFIYCWHALHAYWCGVSSTSPGTEAYGSRVLFPRPTAGTLEIEPSMTWSASVMAGCGVVADPTALHADMHQYLAAAGVDGVKVDVQGTVGLMGSNAGGGAALAAAYHASLERSVREHFGGNHCINCMCHSTENLYRMEDTAVARVSDDFYPADSASWTSHVPICAYNSLFMGALVQPDWDMFHSRHPAALLHATARAVSGGAIYVSDKPGCHDAALLRRLVLPDGSVLRAALPGRPTRDVLFADALRDGRTLLKVWNMNAVNGVLAVFNAQGASWSRSKHRFVTHDKRPPALRTSVRPADVDALASGGGEATRFALFSDRTQRLVTLQAAEVLDVELQAAQSDILVIAPVQQRGSTAFAPLGLPAMLNAGGAVQAFSLHATHGSRTASTTATIDVRGCGQLLAFSSSKPRAVEVCGSSADFSYEADEGKLYVSIPKIDGLRSRVTASFD